MHVKYRLQEVRKVCLLNIILFEITASKLDMDIINSYMDATEGIATWSIKIDLLKELLWIMSGDTNHVSRLLKETIRKRKSC